MGAIRGLWHWRRNPLCRPTDLAESWVALTGLLLILFLVPLTGLLVGGAAQDAMTRSVRAQNATRYEVTATVVRELGRSPLNVDPERATATDPRSHVVARWTAPDGTGHEGPVLSTLDRPRGGDRFPIWTDAQGRAVARPMDTATATTHAVLAGIGAALGAAALVEGARRLVLWRMVRSRYARWDQEWDRVGPDWGRTGSNS
ncbi:hypothetical protein VM636_27720 [Streptomyces sp. SCSIO 75703]|uniref:Rv1733c family protein n=1 Tax=unclassified Streptomyces TaxID=2593676 RepID=UPI0004C0B709|nr:MULTISPECIES: hypothetical protein [unclassified Streptomyces]